jgi:hypothetical protein
VVHSQKRKRKTKEMLQVKRALLRPRPSILKILVHSVSHWIVWAPCSVPDGQSRLSCSNWLQRFRHSRALNLTRSLFAQLSNSVFLSLGATTICHLSVSILSRSILVNDHFWFASSLPCTILYITTECLRVAVV